MYRPNNSRENSFPTRTSLQFARYSKFYCVKCQRYYDYNERSAYLCQCNHSRAICESCFQEKVLLAKCIFCKNKFIEKQSSHNHVVPVNDQISQLDNNRFDRGKGFFSFKQEQKDFKTLQKTPLKRQSPPKYSPYQTKQPSSTIPPFKHQIQQNQGYYDKKCDIIYPLYRLLQALSESREGSTRIRLPQCDCSIGRGQVEEILHETCVNCAAQCKIRGYNELRNGYRVCKGCFGRFLDRQLNDNGEYFQSLFYKCVVCDRTKTCHDMYVDIDERVADSVVCKFCHGFQINQQRLIKHNVWWEQKKKNKRQQEKKIEQIQMKSAVRQIQMIETRQKSQKQNQQRSRKERKEYHQRQKQRQLENQRTRASYKPLYQLQRQTRQDNYLTQTQITLRNEQQQECVAGCGRIVRKGQFAAEVDGMLLCTLCRIDNNACLKGFFQDTYRKEQTQTHNCLIRQNQQSSPIISPSLKQLTNYKVQMYQSNQYKEQIEPTKKKLNEDHVYHARPSLEVQQSTQIKSDNEDNDHYVEQKVYCNSQSSPPLNAIKNERLQVPMEDIESQKSCFICKLVLNEQKGFMIQEEGLETAQAAFMCQFCYYGKRDQIERRQQTVNNRSKPEIHSKIPNSKAQPPAKTINAPLSIISSDSQAPTKSPLSFSQQQQKNQAETTTDKKLFCSECHLEAKVLCFSKYCLECFKKQK